MFFVKRPKFVPNDTIFLENTPLLPALSTKLHKTKPNRVLSMVPFVYATDVQIYVDHCCVERPHQNKAY